MNPTNIIRLDNFYTIGQYNRAGGRGVNTGRNRIKNGLLAAIEIDGRHFIDFHLSPPNKTYPAGRKYPKLKASFPEDIDYHRLRHVKHYAAKKLCRADRFFEAILSGKIFALVIAGETFAYLEDLDATK